VNTFWDGKGLVLAAYDMEGTPLWQKKLGPWISQHGPGASPILYRDKVIYVKDMDYKDHAENDVSDPSVVWVLDKKTGAVVWSAPREAYRACYSAPFILEKPDARPQLLITSTTSIRSYDPQDGQVKWDWRWSFKSKMPLRTTASALVQDGMLFACAGDGGGDRHMVALRLIGNGMPTKAEFAWENRKDFPYVPTLLARGEHLYFVNDRGYAGCFHAATGKQLWLERLPETTFIASPVLIDGKMYAPSEQGDVYVIAAEPTYRLLAKNPLGERLRSSPAVSNNRLYVRGETHLFCIGK
jgi:outer membrane protein assembly factor BamB